MIKDILITANNMSKTELTAVLEKIDLCDEAQIFPPLRIVRKNATEKRVLEDKRREQYLKLAPLKLKRK